MNNFTREIQFHLFQFRQNFRNHAALRASYMLTIAGMLFTNTMFVAIWLTFTHTVGTINGWGMAQTFGIVSMALFIYGITHTLFGGLTKLPPHVQNGSFDAFMTKPKNLYIRIANHDGWPTALADLAQGFICTIIFLCWMKPDLHSIILFLLMIPSAVLTQISYTMTTDLIVFWLPPSLGLSQATREMVIGAAIQPISLLGGWQRLLFMTAIPALIISGLPVEIITYHTYGFVILSYIVSFAWLALSVWLLKISVRRYESGNIIG